MGRRAGPYLTFLVDILHKRVQVEDLELPVSPAWPQHRGPGSTGRGGCLGGTQRGEVRHLDHSLLAVYEPAHPKEVQPLGLRAGPALDLQMKEAVRIILGLIV